MRNNDDQFRHKKEQSIAQNNQPFDKEAWRKQKREQREMVYSMIDNTIEAVAQEGTTLQKYLDVQSRFDRYSVANTLLILAQKPDAIFIADFDVWKEQGAYIRKKETGFYILKPGDEYKRKDGTIGISYNLKKMFDISQTGGYKHESPTYPDERTCIKALMDHAPVPIRISDTLSEGTNAMYQPSTREIQIRKGMDASSIFRALSQELAHAEMDKGDGKYNRSNHAFHAYCVAYILCKQYGVDTSKYNFDAAPHMLAEKDLQEIREDLSLIKKTAFEISDRMKRTLSQQRQQKRQEPEH